ncbi:MAG: hypothetical protein RLZZ187_580 [Pseudomonadota bacterium]
MIRDADLAATLAELASPHVRLTEYEPRHRHGFRRRFAHFSLGSLLMGVGAYPAVRYASADGAGYAMGISLSGSASAKCDGKRYDIHRLQGEDAGSGGLILTPNMPFTVETSDIVGGTIRFDAARLRRALVAVSGNPRIKLPSAPVTGLNASRTTLRAISSLVTFFKAATSNCDDKRYLESIGIEDTIYRSAAAIIIEANGIGKPDGPQRVTVATLDTMRDLMISRLGAPQSLTDLALELGVPARTLQRHFRTRFGMGPIEWLTEQRLLAARDHLAAEKDVSVTETALRFGFMHLGEFSRLFRVRFGQLPRDIARSRGSLPP